VDAWEEHEAAKKAILDRVAEAMRGVEDTAMVHTRYKGRLTRLQTETAGKLGRTRDELMDRFGPELDRLKADCGL
jgi:hypothetical protein